MSRRPPQLTSPPGAPARLTTGPFPAYRYLPGWAPHPVTDPGGHSYGRRDEPAELGRKRLPGDWADVEEYLYGIDLFNAAYLWEAHEAWEAVWHAVDRRSAVGHVLQGLIQASAALLQSHCGRETGAANLRRRARENLASAGRERFMGLDLDRWQERLDDYLGGETTRFPFLEVELPGPPGER